MLWLLFYLISKNFLLSTVEACSGMRSGVAGGGCGSKRKFGGSQRRDFPQKNQSEKQSCVSGAKLCFI